MLDPSALVAKFGDWSQAYADAAIPALRQYGTGHTQLSLRRGGTEDEAVLTIRAASPPAVPHCMMDTAKINQLRSEHDAFRRQCIEVVVWTKKRTIEYTFADASASTSAQIDAKHFSCAWHPDQQLTAVVTPSVAAKRAAIDREMAKNDRLHTSDISRIRRVVSLYLISSAEVPPFRVYVEAQGDVLVFVGVRKLPLSWCMHVIRQADLGVDRVQVTDNEIEFTMVPALREQDSAPQAGAIRSDGASKAGRCSRTSFIGRIKQGISYVL